MGLSCGLRSGNCFGFCTRICFQVGMCKKWRFLSTVPTCWYPYKDIWALCFIILLFSAASIELILVYIGIRLSGGLVEDNFNFAIFSIAPNFFLENNQTVPDLKWFLMKFKIAHLPTVPDTYKLIVWEYHTNVLFLLWQQAMVQQKEHGGNMYNCRHQERLRASDIHD